MIRLAAIVVGLCLVAAAPGTRAAERVLDDLTDGMDPAWQEKTFAGRTRYRLIQDQSAPCIEALSVASASGLVFPIRYQLADWPILRWRWRIDRSLAAGDTGRKEGDDYAARVYVVFPSVLFWRTRALSYVWASRLARGAAVPNPYTANTIMIAVESGDQLAGQWQEEERDVLADFRTHFSGEPPPVGAIGIMTDTDNTGETATACYGPIRLASPAPAAGASRP
ncbi:MAG: DUF3047 domain-containing protein [Thermodesulfobacteriota bacterium]